MEAEVLLLVHCSLRQMRHWETVVVGAPTLPESVLLVAWTEELEATIVASVRLPFAVPHWLYEASYRQWVLRSALRLSPVAGLNQAGTMEVAVPLVEDALRSAGRTDREDFALRDGGEERNMEMQWASPADILGSTEAYRRGRRSLCQAWHW